MDEQSDDYLIQAAIILNRMVPSPSFSNEMALVCAGAGHRRAVSTDLGLKLKTALQFTNKFYGPPSFSMDMQSKKQRYLYFTQIAKIWPSKFSKKGLDSVNPAKIITTGTRADAIRLIGGSVQDTKNGPFYQACKRIDEGNHTIDPSIVPTIEPPSGQSLPSAVRMSMSSTTTAMSSLSGPSNDSFSTSNSQPTSTSVVTHTTNDARSYSSSHKSFLPSKCRLTSKQAHEVRKKKAFENRRRNIAFQVATIMVTEYDKGKIPFMENVPGIIQAVNKMVSNDDETKIFVTSREIIKAVKRGEIGCEPPRQERTSRLPKGAFQHFSDLFFSFGVISQANCEKVLKRTTLISMLDAIISPYFTEKNEITMNAKRLVERILEENSYRQNVEIVHPREQRRFLWFTVENLVAHYRNMEECLVRRGYARNSTHEEEQQSGEKIKWFPNQCCRAGNIDEMSWGFGHDANGLGGRPGMSLTTELVPTPGDPAQKSSLKVTLLYGMTFADEALPPLIILPSSAENPIIRERLLCRFDQVVARYGNPRRKAFDCMIAYSNKGSMTKGIFQDYLKRFLNFYPDLRNVDGKRFFLKMDSGNGHCDEEGLAMATVLGVDLYAGVPNTSEGTQECDQVFSYNKALMERNRRTLFELKVSAGDGTVTLYDLPALMFGGKVEFSNGKSVVLPNPFEKAFDAEHLKAARFKCGYCPATRVAILNPKCRRSVDGDDIESNLLGPIPKDNEGLEKYIQKIEDNTLKCDDGSRGNGYQNLLNSIQTMNHTSATALVQLGFENATLGQKSLKREEHAVSLRSNSTTVHGTRSHQEKLATDLHTAGKFFRATNGGEMYNVDDCLIGIERQTMKKEAVKMEKIKKVRMARTKIVEEAKTIIEGGGPRLKPEFLKCIMWKSKTKNAVGNLLDVCPA